MSMLFSFFFVLITQRERQKLFSIFSFVVVFGPCIHKKSPTLIGWLLPRWSVFENSTPIR